MKTPASSLAGVGCLAEWLTQLTTLVAQRRSELRHHLLRDVDASDILFVSDFRHCRSGLHFWVRHRNVSGGRCGIGINFHASFLQAPKISEYSQHVTVPAFFFFRLRMRHDTTAALLLTMYSPSFRIETDRAAVSRQFTTSYCCGPVVVCDLNKICSPNATICSMNGLSHTLVSRHK